MGTKSCERCEKPLPPRHYRWCSKECYLNIQEKRCLFCDALLPPNKSKYCSREHTLAYYQSKKPKKYCIVCGKVLTGHQTKYCSKMEAQAHIRRVNSIKKNMQYILALEKFAKTESSFTLKSITEFYFANYYVYVNGTWQSDKYNAYQSYRGIIALFSTIDAINKSSRRSWKITPEFLKALEEYKNPLTRYREFKHRHNPETSEYLIEAEMGLRDSKYFIAEMFFLEQNATMDDNFRKLWDAWTPCFKILKEGKV